MQKIVKKKSKNFVTIKKHPSKYWFKRKTYGFGWVPASWQGWFVLLLYSLLLFILLYSREEYIPGNPDSGSNFLVSGLPITVLTTLLVYIAYIKGEKPKWQWGTSKLDSTKDTIINDIKMKNTKISHFEIEINTELPKVWENMLGSEGYKTWTLEFNPGGSWYEKEIDGEFTLGEKVKFLGPDPNGQGEVGGMLSVVKEIEKFHFISFEHYGYVVDGKEITDTPEVASWAPACEKYTFEKMRENKTKIIVDVEMSADYSDMMAAIWPNALLKLKEICEA